MISSENSIYVFLIKLLCTNLYQCIRSAKIYNFPTKTLCIRVGTELWFKTSFPSWQALKLCFNIILRTLTTPAMQVNQTFTIEAVGSHYQAPYFVVVIESLSFLLSLLANGMNCLILYYYQGLRDHRSINFFFLSLARYEAFCSISLF